MSLRIKTKQGISNICEHAQDDRTNKENISLNSRSKSSNASCLLCLKHIFSTIERIRQDNFLTLPAPLLLSAPMPLASAVMSNNGNDIVKSIYQHKKSPLVSISVVDTDNNLNVCMCALMRDDDSHFISGDILKTSTENDEKICPICRNFIKQQPYERLTLISKRMMLGNDVVVNRIDTQYLSSNYSTSSSNLRRLHDPYTPEDSETHSPQPEYIDEREFPIINETTDSDEILENIHKLNSKKISQPVLNVNDEELRQTPEISDDKTSQHNHQNHNNISHTVSPRQLKSRLEILRRESGLGSDPASIKSGGIGGENDGKEPLNKRKCCFSHSCVII